MLVRCYPPSIRVEDPAGDLPAHTSIRYHLPKEMTLALLDFYQEAIDIPDKLGNTLLLMAIRCVCVCVCVCVAYSLTH